MTDAYGYIKETKELTSAETDTLTMSSRIFNVSSDTNEQYNTIQSAIDAATILVTAESLSLPPIILIEPGLYAEDLTITKGVVLRSLGPHDGYNGGNSCIVQGTIDITTTATPITGIEGIFVFTSDNTPTRSITMSGGGTTILKDVTIFPTGSSVASALQFSGNGDLFCRDCFFAGASSTNTFVTGSGAAAFDHCQSLSAGANNMNFNNTGSITMTDCFIQSTSTGDCVNISNNANCMIRGCVISNQQTGATGDGMNISGSSGTIDIFNTTFDVRTTAGAGARAIEMAGSGAALVLTDVRFVNNVSVLSNGDNVTNGAVASATVT